MALDDTHSESLQHLLSDTRTHPRLALGPVSLCPGDVVEIHGPSSSGKTHVLYHVLAHSLLSSTSAAIVYDTDHAFSVTRLRSVLLARLGAHPSVDACLKRLHVFSPSSSLHLAASIRALPSYHARFIPHSHIALVIVDSLSPFYWSDRFTAEEHRAVQSKTDSASARVNSTLDTVPLHAVLTSLQRLRASLRPLVLYTNWALNPLADPSLDSIAYKQHLHFLSPHVSSLLPLTYHITLPLAPFNPRAHPPLVPITPDPGEEPPMDDETDDRRVLCLLRTPGRSDINTFTFRITHDDVIF